jgi:nucleotide-binding universal stress UspA family protein
MPATASIVVGTDFSRSSIRAVSRAGRLAERLGARLIATHVVKPGHASKKEVEEIAADAWRLLEDGGASTRVESTKSVRVGAPYLELGKAALAERANLIVIGVHQPKHDMETFFLGSTAEGVLRSGHCAVLLARLNATRLYRKALVAIDVGETTPRLLRAVKELLPDTELALVHCVTPSENRRSRSKDDSSKSLATLRKHVEDFASLAELDPAHHTIHLATARDPRNRILELAKFHGVDLIAMGTHARHGLNRLLLGSIAEYVVRAAAVDVLVVPPGE